MYSSVTAGTGDLAWAGGGGGCFFSAESVADATTTASTTSKARGRALENIMPLL
jgi:hypothetical protein